MPIPVFSAMVFAFCNDDTNHQILGESLNLLLIWREMFSPDNVYYIHGNLLLAF